MMNNPIVTIAIPFYKDSKYLSQAIMSVINQTYNSWELILIDDGGFDGSLEIARSFEQKDNRIKVFSDGKNYGLAKRLNQTISMAKGKYYARMDADDIMCIERLDKEVTFLEFHPDVDVVGSSAMLINDKNEIVGSGDMGEICSRFIHPTIMGKTEWFRRNLYAESLRRAQDTELWLRTSKISVFYNLQEPLMFYRELGVPSLRKYLKTQKTLRKIFADYKNYGKSIFWYVKNSMDSFVKSILFLLYAAIGKSDVFIKMRRRRTLPQELWLSFEDLQKAIETK